MPKPNRFSLLSDALKESEAEPEDNEIAADEVEEAEPEAPRRRKRKKTGKRSDPNYEQVGAYIPKKLAKRVRKRLIDYDDLDFSELVAGLLKEWLEKPLK